MNYYLSQWVINGLNDGSIDHLEYRPGNEVARVVWANGSTCLTDIVATEDRRERERDEFRRRVAESGGFSVPVTLRVTLKNFGGFLYNAGA